MSNPVSFETAVDVYRQCLCLHTQRAARMVARRFDAGLKRHGMTSGQFTLLMALNRPAPVSMSWVAELLAIDRTSLTAALKPLQRQERVRVETDNRDRRSRLLTLTEAGKDALSEALPSWKRLQRDEEARVTSPDDLRAELNTLR